jgi:hypothetical protein
MSAHRRRLALIQAVSDDVLNLAVKYDGLRQCGYTHAEALPGLHRKMGSLCTPEGVEQALALLRRLKLPVEGKAVRA